jgi:hypothetical protein
MPEPEPEPEPEEVPRYMYSCTAIPGYVHVLQLYAYVMLEFLLY